MTGDLTATELAVLDKVSYGSGSAAVARALHMSEDTVKSHLRRIYSKLGVPDRSAAVRAGFERGLLQPSPTTVLASLLPNGVFTEPTRRRPMTDVHIAACFAAESCPCREQATWAWHKPDGAGSVNGDG